MKIITGIISNTKIVFSAFFILFVLYLIAVLFFGVPFIESLGVISGIVTILTAVVTYVIWLNTKKLIEKRKMEKIYRRLCTRQGLSSERTGTVYGRPDRFQKYHCHPKNKYEPDAADAK